MSKATLVDTTKCIGCRSCQVTCKQWNDLPATKTELQVGTLGIQNPTSLSSKTLAVVTQTEVDDPKAPGGIRMVFTKRQCMHCDDPACASACPVTALHKTKDGPVVYDADKCLGCRYCMWACPFGAPTADWDSLAPKIHKCTLCANREQQPPPAERNGQKLTPEEQARWSLQQKTPACVKQCPAGALTFGDRGQLLAEARRRMKDHPGRYVDHIYGEKEAGGTAMLYLAGIPFTALGMADVGTRSYPERSVTALSAVPPAVLAVGALLGGTYAMRRRKVEAAQDEHHPHFEPVKRKLLTGSNLLLLLLMLWGGVSFVLRFVYGLGGATNLSDTYAWGLWIVFDLVWIAVAAGAFATAGIIYVLQRKDLYSIGRGAVLMGLLSYSFVTVTLLADLGLPWHFWQLGVQAPKHSAMFEVSWCVGLYVTILAFEFFPVPFERWGLKRFMELWQKFSPVYVVIAVTLFVFLMSRNLVFTAAALVVFSFLAYALRQKPGEKPVPIMLAIAAVTFSTMHQSSLGSLFLLMPDKLSPLWWSPIIPILFFLSSIAAGIALVTLIEMWIAKGLDRPLRMAQLATLGQVAFIALLIYELVRIGDLAVRGQLAAAFSAPKSGLLLAEIGLGGALPLLLLASRKLRSSPATLGLGASLSLAGVIFNRVCCVILAMTLKGPAPQTAPHAYTPSIYEWGVSLGLIAATIFLFRWGASVMPVLPAEEAKAGGDAAPAADGTAHAAG
jgi:formate dehydrogenase iron-sulfur subunit